MGFFYGKFGSRWPLKRSFHSRFLNWPPVPKKPNLHTNELFDELLKKTPNCLKFLKLARRFILTSCDIYQNPFTEEKIPKF
jgi:hypothetical protein